MNKYNSEISGFYKLPIEKRQEILAKLINLNDEEKELLSNYGYFTPTQIDTLGENVVGSYSLPFGLAFNFKVNEKDYIVPMVTEEPSVIAAASNSAKIARAKGGFRSDNVKSLMIAQIQITQINDLHSFQQVVRENKDNILKIANDVDPLLTRLGGGAEDLEFREINTNKGKMVIVHLLVNVLDAMGANIVNTMAEAISPRLEELSQGKVYLRIVSNLATERIARCIATFDKELLGGAEVVEGILQAYEFALADPYRATTHNKGIMNGIIALTLATGNDTRAIEAGAHAFASLGGGYKPLTKFSKDNQGNLFGEINIPLALGILGGMTKIHPMARLALKILDVKSAGELSQVASAVGLAQNVAALKALATEGIQKGHMKLHSKNIAKLAGVPEKYVEEVAKQMINEKAVRVYKAEEIYQKIRNRNNL